jgi:hypothetical protein
MADNLGRAEMTDEYASLLLVASALLFYTKFLSDFLMLSNIQLPVGHHFGQFECCLNF